MTTSAISELRAIVARLREPNGCPWDLEQTHLSLRGGLLEEAYEVVAAIDAADDVNLREELGDLLLQVVFHSQIAAEESRFSLDDVASGITEKLIRRHPHVFGNETLGDPAAVLKRWDEIKRSEKQTAGAAAVVESALDGVPTGLPALMHAQRIQKKAGKVGFDWDAAEPVIAKVREELVEVEQAVTTGNRGQVEDEIGDLLFAVVNLSRKLRIDPEVALRRATAKFADRFQSVESLARQRNLSLSEMSLADLDLLWDEVKQSLR